MIALPLDARPEPSLRRLPRRCGLHRPIKPIELALRPFAHVRIGVSDEPLHDLTCLASRAELLQDFRTAPDEPVVSSDMLPRFGRLNAGRIGLLELCAAQLR
jgi:hypothetical protein